MRPVESAGPASRTTVAVRLSARRPKSGIVENAARSFTGRTPHPRFETDRATDSEQCTERESRKAL